MLREVVERPRAAQRSRCSSSSTRSRGDPRALQSEYVDTFDVTRKCSLHLTYFTQGDTRRRGVALVEFKQAYRHAGLEFDSDVELPDHLCVVLESVPCRTPPRRGSLLNRHRVGVEVLRAGLAQRDSPWLPVSRRCARRCPSSTVTTRRH